MVKITFQFCLRISKQGGKLFRDGWYEIFRSEYHKANFQERILQLEGAPAISPKEARAIAREVIEAQRSSGIAISDEKAEVIADLNARGAREAKNTNI